VAEISTAFRSRYLSAGFFGTGSITRDFQHLTCKGEGERGGKKRRSCWLDCRYGSVFEAAHPPDFINRAGRVVVAAACRLYLRNDWRTPLKGVFRLARESSGISRLRLGGSTASAEAAADVHASPFLRPVSYSP